DVNRYEAVFDVHTMATFLDTTLGRATELDRALGYEANAEGTSYLSDPIQMIGTYQAGAPLINVMADRNTPGSAAWVQWDAEGVAPTPFPLVQAGRLVDFQTTREFAPVLAPYYTAHDQPVGSRACAEAPGAIDAPMLHTANLVLGPGHDAKAGFDELVAGVAKGIAITRAGIDMDFEAISGMGRGATYEITHGKRTAIIDGAGFLFNAPAITA
ncbi:MAG: metallopeptidase TldD-related protein, partial [Gemmatimonadaceae bacterium]